MPFTGMPLAGVNPTVSSLAAAGLRMPGQPTPNCVLLISNLNEEVGIITAYLFHLNNFFYFSFS